jgi:hypothetical protein
LASASLGVDPHPDAPPIQLPAVLANFANVEPGMNLWNDKIVFSNHDPPPFGGLKSIHVEGFHGMASPSTF